MSEQKHTSGPWIVYEFLSQDCEGDDAETHIQCYADDDGENGASLAFVNRWTYGDEPATEESKANARLIAAAPELLEALKYLCDVSHTDPKAFDQARAAIAKATGADQ